MKSIVLFGAGASFGAGIVYPYAPPLGGSLFSELEAKYPRSWGALPADLTDSFSSDFEAGMGQLWRSGSHAISRLLQEMAIYFSRFSLSTNRHDAYSTLIDQIQARGRLDDVRFSTLNYECVFEIALSMAGRRVNYFEPDLAASSASALWKLHGSCNFLPHGGINASRGVTFGSGVTFGTGIRACDPGEVETYCNGNTALYPVMAIYAVGKPVQIAPDPMKELQSSWTAAVKQADRIAVVGVRPRVEDDHIWGPLAETDAEIAFVGSVEAASHWAANYRIGRPSRVIGERFRQSVSQLALWL